jgi:hypothetical protein
MCFDPSIGMSYDTFGNRFLLTIDDTGPCRCGNGGSTAPAPCTAAGRGLSRGGGRHKGRMGMIHRHHPLCTKGIVAKHPTRVGESSTSHHGVHHGQGVGTSTKHHRHATHTTIHASPKGIVSCSRRRRCGKGSPKFLLKELFKDLKGVMKVVMLLIVLLVMVMLLLLLWLLGIVGWFVTRTVGGSGGFSLSFS